MPEKFLNPKGKWIVISGLDGSGKTTLKKNLAELLPGTVKTFHLPFNRFALDMLDISGNGHPTADSYTDRLIFTLDARIANYQIKTWMQQYDVLISQRAWMDNYVHGAVQGFSYEETRNLLQTNDLVQPSAVIHMTADPSVAYGRIKDDLFKDKFEIPSYINKQYVETEKLYVACLNNKVPEFAGIPATFIDSTDLNPEDVLHQALGFLASIGITYPVLNH